MIKRIAEKFSDWIIRNDPNSSNDYETFVYVIQCIIGLVLANGFILIVASIISMPLHSIVWIVFYNALRFYIGGYHARTFSMCILGGTIFSVLCIIGTDYMVQFPFFLLLEIGGSILIVFFIAPVVHINRLMSEEQIKKKHRIGKLIVLVESGLIILFFFFFSPWVAHSASIGMFSAALLCVAGKVSKTNRKE